MLAAIVALLLTTAAPPATLERVHWQPAKVRFPVGAAEELRPAGPGMETASGPLELGPGRAASLWLAPLQLVRVTAGSGQLRFRRVGARDGQDVPALEQEVTPELVKPGTWYLHEPVGGGSTWLISAEAPVSIRIERPEVRLSRKDAEAARARLAEWVRSGEGPPPLLDPEARTQLTLDAELAEALRSTPAGARLAEAVIAWRMGSALRTWARLEPVGGSGFRIAPLAPPGTAATLDDGSEWTRVSGEWALSVEGPGLVELEARALAGQPRAALTVERAGAQAEATALDTGVRPAGNGGPRERVFFRRALETGEGVAAEETVRVLVPPGRQQYRIRFDGELLVEARFVSRRPFLGEAVRRDGEWWEWLERAEALCANEQSVEAGLLRAQLAGLRGEWLGLPENVEGAAPLVTQTIAVLRAERGGALPGEPGALPWHLRVRLAQVMIDRDLRGEALRLLLDARGFPEPGWIAAEAAELLSALPLGDAQRSQALAAMELAHRREPLSEELRARYLRLFYRTTRWSVAAPTQGQAASLAAPSRWLDVEPVEDGRLGPGAHWPLHSGAPVKVEVPAVPGGAAVLRAYVSAPPGSRPVLRVGAARFPVPASAGVEPIELAVPAGEHEVALEGPGASAFLSRVPREAAAPARVGYVRTHWPLRAGEGWVRFPVPDPQLSTPVRVQLRARAPLSEPVELWLHSDVGRAQKLVLHPAKASKRSRALDGNGTASVMVGTVVVALPPLTRQVWFETRSRIELFASLAVRKDDPVDADTAATAIAQARSDPAQTLERLLTLSRELDRSAHQEALLLERAALLIGLGEEALARGDLARALASPLTLAQSQRAIGLLEAIDEVTPDRVQLGAPLEKPIAIYPAASALPDDPQLHARYEAARALATTDPEAAALALIRLYQRTHLPQLGVEALLVLERLDGPERWEGGLASMALALTTELSKWAEPSIVRRVRARAGRWTRWELLTDAEEKAGALSLTQTGRRPEVRELVRKALLAPPWPLDEVCLVRAGNAAVLELELSEPEQLSAQVLCKASEAQAEEPCSLELRIDGTRVSEEEAALGEIATLSARLDQPGRHQVELLVRGGSAPGYAVVRFSRASSDRALAASEPLPLLRARRGRPLTVTVLGPTALRIGARSTGPGNLLRVSSEQLVDGGERTDAELALPDAADPQLSSGTLQVLGEGELMLLLPERGAHRVRVEPTGAEALVQVHSGASRGGVGGSGLGALSHAIEPLQWPAMPGWLEVPESAELPAASRRRFGTLSLQAGYLDEELEEEEVFDRPVRTALEGRLLYRQALKKDRAWLRVELLGRSPLESGALGGLSATLHLTHLPLELRATARVGAFVQRGEDGNRQALRTFALVDRALGLHPDLQLIPGLGIAWDSFGGSAPADTLRFDALALSGYRLEHPLRLTPRVTARWQPLRDQLGRLSLGAGTNADLASLDYVSAKVRWSCLFLRFPVPMRTEVGYGASHRFADEHRVRSYLRHELSGRVDWHAWRMEQGRVVVFLQDSLFLYDRYGMQNVLGVGLRWDWTGGRGLEDFAPPEEDFEDLLER